MTHISGTKELQEVLAKIMNAPQIKGALSDIQRLKIIDILVPAIQAGGGLDLEDPKSIDKLKQGMKAVMLNSKLFNNPSLSPANKIALAENHDEILKNIFENKPTPEQNKKLTIAMAYMKILENDPGKNISLSLAMMDPAQLTPSEKKQLVADLAVVFTELNKMQKDPKMKLDMDKLADLIGMIKKEIEKPGSTNALANTEDKGLTDTLTNLFGVDPHVPGKIAGPLMVLAGNTMGIVDAYPAMAGSHAPIDSFSGNILDSAQSATGVDAIARAREDDMGGLESAIDSVVDTVTSSVAATMDADDAAPTPKQEEPGAEKLGGLQKAELPTNENQAAAEVVDEHKFKTPLSMRPPTPTPGGGSK